MAVLAVPSTWTRSWSVVQILIRAGIIHGTGIMFWHELILRVLDDLNDIDDIYLSVDTGLKTRMEDISHKPEALSIKSEDRIISLVRNIINEST